MNDRVKISVTSNYEKVDSSKIYIYDEDNKYFWNHHNNTLEDKKQLENACKLIDRVYKKSKEPNFNIHDLTDIEQKTYNCYIDQQMAPKLRYDQKENKYYLSDGRHRMKMCKDLEINPILQVTRTLEFEIVRCDLSVKRLNPIEAIKSFLFKDKGINNYIRIEDKPYKFINLSYSIDNKDYTYMAFDNNDINKEILSKTNAAIINNKNCYLVAEYSKATLDKIIGKYQEEKIQENIYLTTERINNLEDIEK